MIAALCSGYPRWGYCEVVCLEITTDCGSEITLRVWCQGWDSELYTAKGIYGISYLKVNWISTAGVGT